MNYLPDARNHGAEIFTPGRRCGIWSGDDDGKAGSCTTSCLDSGREKFDAPDAVRDAPTSWWSRPARSARPRFCCARRPRACRSPTRSASVSRGNGDVLGFGYNGEQRDQRHRLRRAAGQDRRQPVGPCITGDHRPARPRRLDDGWSSRKARSPARSAPMLPAWPVRRRCRRAAHRGHGFIGKRREKERELESFVRGPYHGAMHNTQTYLVMGTTAAGADGAREGSAAHRLAGRRRAGRSSRSSTTRSEQATKAARRHLRPRIRSGASCSSRAWSRCTRSAAASMAEDAAQRRGRSEGPGLQRRRATRVYEGSTSPTAR